MNASVKLLEHVVPATVAVRAEVPETHPSAPILGTERFGSGVVVDFSGLILTVNYVVLGARSVTVTFTDDRVLDGVVVAQDFATALAVVDVGQARPSALPMCPSEHLQVGQEIFIAAATSDEGKRRVANGAITSLAPFDAYWEYSLERAIVTTAINPGLGGAPLLDSLGQVIGIVSLELNEIGRFSLAIPVDAFRDHREELLRHGHRVSRPPRAWVGFYCYTFQEHVVIAGVIPGAPGELAGLRPGDVVLEVDGQPVSDRHDLYVRLWGRRPGEMIDFRVYRNSEVKQVTVSSGNAEAFFA